MHDNVAHAGRKEGAAWTLQSVRRHLSKLGHRLCFIVGCSKHSHIPAPSFKRMWKRTRKFIIQIPCEFMLASSADISYVVFFTDEEKRFDFCLYVFHDNDLYSSFCNRCLLFRESAAEFDGVV